MKCADLGDVRELGCKVGREIAVSDWKTISQDDIDQFGRASGDDHWIHTDCLRSQANSPYGKTIAQGLLSLCFLDVHAKEVMNNIDGCFCVNYGFDRVRFPAPVHPGQRIRAHLKIASVTKLVGGGNITWVGTVEIEKSEKPACYAEFVCHFFSGQDTDRHPSLARFAG